MSRALDWHVRDQVEFNRGVMGAIEAMLAALNENNRALRELAGRIAAMQPLAADLYDTRSQWIAWRGEWERKVAANETQFLRGLADLQMSYNHRATLMEGSFRDLARSQHGEFAATLDRGMAEIQKRLWADLERIRAEYETVIHGELRLVRQRAGLLAPAAPPVGAGASAQPAPRMDYMKFADKFRGPEEYVREGQRFYVEKFRGCADVLDAGCGRGEFLELMKEAGIPARGIDLSEEMVALCRRKGLTAEAADMFSYLTDLADQSIDGDFLRTSSRASTTRSCSRVHPAGACKAAPRRRAGGGDAESGEPGDLRDAFLSRSDAHAADPACAAGLLHRRGRIRQDRSAAVRTGRRVDARSERVAGGVSREIFRRAGLCRTGAAAGLTPCQERFRSRYKS